MNQSQAGSSSPQEDMETTAVPAFKQRARVSQAEFNQKNSNQSEGYKATKMFQYSCALRSGPSQKESMNLNPIWMNFPSKCVQKVTSAAEMKKLLDYHSHSDEVFVVRYHQNSCTACNAADKAFEFMCHDSKKFFPKLTYYEVNKDDSPELTKGMVRFPQIKGFAGGQWSDIDFKPPAAFREKLLRDVESEVQRLSNRGQAITALEAEEMYFSAAGPSMLLVLEDNIYDFYTKAQTRLHNYWKQVSVRRSWFYKKHIQPHTTPSVVDAAQLTSVFGEKVVYGPTSIPTPNDA